MADTRVNGPLSELEISVIRTRHLFLIGERQKSCETFGILKSKAKETDEKLLSQIDFYLGRGRWESNQYEAAKDHFLASLSDQHNDADRKWREPQVHLYLALCYAKLEQKDRAAEELRKCLSFDDYQESPRIRFRAKELWKSLNLSRTDN
jgi:tetratricopeptide (TPR) repeat protein